MTKTKTKTNKKLSVISKKIKPFSLICLVFMWLVYLVSTNYAANQSFELDALGKNIKTLQQEVLFLNVEASELQSIERIETVSNDLSLVQIKDIYYLTDDREAVALK